MVSRASTLILSVCFVSIISHKSPHRVISLNELIIYLVYRLAAVSSVKSPDHVTHRNKKKYSKPVVSSAKTMFWWCINNFKTETWVFVTHQTGSGVFWGWSTSEKTAATNLSSGITITYRVLLFFWLLWFTFVSPIKWQLKDKCTRFNSNS